VLTVTAVLGGVNVNPARDGVTVKAPTSTGMSQLPVATVVQVLTTPVLGLTAVPKTPDTTGPIIVIGIE
jgi:hypothetical protein